ncbi:hypothetical protein F5Y18DRAFT_254142 [Xylariaceae sp. FL1019]|nr:hypothetical protein F5Y18DRAFT_254142 [Xylariaceae sp. FL1019]
MDSHRLLATTVGRDDGRGQDIRESEARYHNFHHHGDGQERNSIHYSRGRADAESLHGVSSSVGGGRYSQAPTPPMLGSPLATTAGFGDDSSVRFGSGRTGSVTAASEKRRTSSSLDEKNAQQSRRLGSWPSNDSSPSESRSQTAGAEAEAEAARPNPKHRYPSSHQQSTGQQQSPSEHHNPAHLVAAHHARLDAAQASSIVLINDSPSQNPPHSSTSMLNTKTPDAVYTRGQQGSYHEYTTTSTSHINHDNGGGGGDGLSENRALAQVHSFPQAQSHHPSHVHGQANRAHAAASMSSGKTSPTAPASTQQLEYCQPAPAVAAGTGTGTGAIANTNSQNYDAQLNTANTNITSNNGGSDKSSSSTHHLDHSQYSPNSARHHHLQPSTSPFLSPSPTKLSSAAHPHSVSSAILATPSSATPSSSQSSRRHHHPHPHPPHPRALNTASSLSHPFSHHHAPHSHRQHSGILASPSGSSSLPPLAPPPGALSSMMASSSAAMSSTNGNGPSSASPLQPPKADYPRPVHAEKTSGSFYDPLTDSTKPRRTSDGWPKQVCTYFLFCFMSSSETGRCTLQFTRLPSFAPETRVILSVCGGYRRVCLIQQADCIVLHRRI